MDCERFKKVADVLSHGMDEADIYLLGMDGQKALAHHGIKKMKWGVRRWQNEDGSLTPAGKIRYSKRMQELKAAQEEAKKKIENKKVVNKMEEDLKKEEAKLKRLEDRLLGKKPNSSKKQNEQNDDPDPTPSKPKTPKEMSDDELRAAISRMKLEQDYNERYSNLNPKKVSLGKRLVNEVLIPGLKDASKEIVKNVAKDFVTKQVGKMLDPDNKTTSKQLKQEIDTISNQMKLDKVKKDQAEAQAKAKKEAEEKAKKEAADRRKKWNSYWDRQSRQKQSKK